MADDKRLPVIGFTMGDPGGIGPELVLRTLDYFSSGLPFIPIVFGSPSVLKHPFLSPLLLHKLESLDDDFTGLKPNTMYIKPCCALADFEEKRPASANGFAAYSYIKSAVKAVQEGVVDAIVTAPICKESLQLADLNYTGHTTMLQELSGAKDVSMAFHTSRLNVVLATIHVPLKEVSQLITADMLQRKIEHAIGFMKQCGRSVVRVAIAGLNPHAGENGMFGHEELDVIQPLIDKGYFGSDAIVTGPYPADTLFHRAYHDEFDVVVAMYHDQGLIPVKLFGFYEAVNVTLGLPFVRTSPDHGTAFDRAYEQLSSIDSMLAATNLAMRLAIHS